VIVESQKPEDLPLDMQMDIPADRTSVAYGKLLKEMGLGQMDRMTTSRSASAIFDFPEFEADWRGQKC
jgi:hypothetical protein